MPVIDTFRTAGFGLCLGAGVLVPLAFSSPGMAADAAGAGRAAVAPVAGTTDGMKDAAKGATKDAGKEEARIRQLLGTGQDPAVRLAHVQARQGRFQLHFVHQLDVLPDPYRYFRDVSGALLRQAQVLARHGIPVAGLSLSALIPALVDDGKGGLTTGAGKNEVLRLTVPRADIDNVNWSQATPLLLLDVAGARFSRAGLAAARLFCQEQAHAAEAPLFCMAVGAGERQKAPMSVLMKSGRAPAERAGDHFNWIVG